MGPGMPPRVSFARLPNQPPKPSRKIHGLSSSIRIQNGCYEAGNSAELT
jgi:hypothetical protein